MPRIKQVLRCHVTGNGTKTISDLMDISRSTVKKYFTTFNQSGKTIEKILAMDEPDLPRLLKRSRPQSSPFHVGPVNGTQEGLQHSHVEGLPKFIVEVD